MVPGHLKNLFEEHERKLRMGQRKSPQTQVRCSVGNAAQHKLNRLNQLVNEKLAFVDAMVATISLVLFENLLEESTFVVSLALQQLLFVAVTVGVGAIVFLLLSMVSISALSVLWHASSDRAVAGRTRLREKHDRAAHKHDDHHEDGEASLRREQIHWVSWPSRWLEFLLAQSQEVVDHDGDN